MTLFHPRRRTLTAYALGDLENRVKVARHLEVCTECRQLVGFTQRLEGAAVSLPHPAPDDAVLARALASRGAGARFILPANPPTHQPANPRWLQVGGLVAAAVVIGVWAFQRPNRMEFTSGNELLLAGFVPRSAEAGQGGRDGSPMIHHLRPLTATYQRRFTDSATKRVTDAGKLDVRVASAGTGRWQVNSGWREIAGSGDMQGAASWIESVTVGDTSLVPSARIVHVKPYRKWAGIYINQRFRNDSVVGQMALDEDPTRRPIGRSLRGEHDRLIASEALAPVFFMGLPLLPGAEFDVTILGWAVVPNDFLVPMHMKIEGSERVETPVGTFDCWRFVITIGRETHYHWVRKSDHLAVLTRRRMDGGRTRELILVGEGGISR